jgi:hypothetical protein
METPQFEEFMSLKIFRLARVLNKRKNRTSRDRQFKIARNHSMRRNCPKDVTARIVLVRLRTKYVTGRELSGENYRFLPGNSKRHHSALRFSFMPGLKNKKSHRKSSYHGGAGKGTQRGGYGVMGPETGR